jgi:hypothetical protein
MPDEETTQQAEEQPAEEAPKEEVFEFVGAGFIPGVAGMYANCRVVLDPETKEVLRIEPLEGAAPASITVNSGPTNISVNAAPAQPVEQPAEPPTQQQSNGG